MGEEINATVYVVDDDEAILDSLQLLLKTAGFSSLHLRWTREILERL